MKTTNAFYREPRLDRTSIGISFVDILFALVVGQILAPVATWMTRIGTSVDSKTAAKVPTIVTASWLALTVALVLTITSWIGYHNSSNAAHFQLKFVNVELVKLGLLHVRLTVVVTDHAACSWSSKQGGGVKASSNATGVSLPRER